MRHLSSYVHALMIGGVVLMLAACVPAQTELDAHATRVATDIFATLEAETPLRPAEVYAQIAPSVVYLESDSGATGSGGLIEVDGEKYVVTNAHVVWPHTHAAVIFPDGSVVDSAPVVQTDALRDLAVLGPIDTDAPVLEISASARASIGDEVYLIGYPAEGELFPQPAIARGLISRIRTWAEEDIDFLQTDTAIAGGQSGGLLVAGDGEILGISGQSFGEARAFALSIATADVRDYIEELARGEDVNGLGDRTLPLLGRRRTLTTELPSPWSRRVFVFDEAPGKLLEMEATSDNDLGMFLVDSFGDVVVSVDEAFDGTETMSATLASAGPHLLLVEQYSETGSKFTVEANQRFAVYEDPEEEVPIAIGESIIGALDYYDDVDTFLIELTRGDSINVRVDSTTVDPLVYFGSVEDEVADYDFDDDSGRGILGTNVQLSYTTLDAGLYRIVVMDSFGGQVGGYILTVEEE